MNDVCNGFYSITLGLGIGLLACSVGSRVSDEPVSSALAPPVGAVEVSSASARVEAGAVCPGVSEMRPPCEKLCSDNHLVARSAGGSCQEVAGWRSELRAGFCTYEWQSERPPLSRPTDTEPECWVAPTGSFDPLVAELVTLRPPAEQYGTVVVPSEAKATPVMIAVVDTAPSRADVATCTTPLPQPVGFEGGAEHGRAMASIVSDIACEAGTPFPCPRAVQTYLGLPRERDEKSPNKHVFDATGGYYGLQTDLAQGILDALAGFDCWKSKSGNKEAKLIINLSVGWEPACGALASAPVRNAIEKATLKGALVLAASGNHRPGSCVEGLTAPGVWGTVSVGANLPLLHAITPVDDQLADLASARPDSDTRIATRGFMIVTTDETTGQEVYLGPYSGSSVSTAIASGIAALVWSYHPNLEPQEVMDVLWESGTPRMSADPPTKVVADSFHGQQAPEQHVISACGALQHAAGCTVGNPCSWSGCAEPSGDAGLDLHLAWANTTPIPNPNLITNTPGPRALVSCASCSGSSQVKVFGSPTIPALPNPWVLPQPDDPPCPACELEIDPPNQQPSTMTLKRNYLYDSYTVVGTTIVLNGQGTSETYYYTRSQLELASGTTYTIQDSGFEYVGNGNPTTGTVSVTFQGSPNFTVSNAISIIQ